MSTMNKPQKIKYCLDGIKGDAARIAQIVEIPKTIYAISRVLYTAQDQKRHGKGKGMLKFWINDFTAGSLYPFKPVEAINFTVVYVKVHIERHHPYSLLIDDFGEGEIYEGSLIRWTDNLHNESEEDVPIIQELLKTRIQELTEHSMVIF